MSENLVTLAGNNNFLVTEDNKIHVAKTYGSTFPAGSRTSIYQGTYSEYMDMFLEPAEKVSALDAMKLLGYRGENTAYDSNLDTSIRAIGTNAQAECHIFEIDSNAVDDISTIQWLAM